MQTDTIRDLLEAVYGSLYMSRGAKERSLSNIDTFFGEVVDSGALLQCWGIAD